MNSLKNQQMAEPIDGIYQELETLLMQNIIRHCQDYNQPIATDEWLLKKLAEVGKLNQENIKIIAKTAGLSQTAVERMLNMAAEEALGQVEPGLAYLTRRGLAGEAVELTKSKRIQRTMSTLQDQAKDTMNLCNTTMLYKARDAFQKLVQDMASKASEIADKQEFLDAMNKHVSAAVIGAESRQQAVRKCIREFNAKGIPAFVDKRGREWTPEAYVNMAMRNTVRSVADEVQTARCLDYGVHLIQIDSHSGARPKCARDQGKIFDLNNGSGETEDARGRKIQYEPWNSSSYGEPDGILGINCGHHKFPFVPGVNIRSYFPTEDMETNDRLYRQTQVQRALERDVRKQKRLCMLYNEAGDTEAFEKAAVKLKQKEANLRTYVDGKPDLHRRKDREQVVGFDRSVSSKAVAANKVYAKSMNAVKMRLPKQENVSIPEAKFTQYALNPKKDPNKARAFKEALGYDLSNSDDLIRNIKEHISEFSAVEKPDNGHGRRYEVVMELTGPNGKTANVLTAWIDDVETGEMRLTTAHVDKRRQKRGNKDV